MSTHRRWRLKIEEAAASLRARQTADRPRNVGSIGWVSPNVTVTMSMLFGTLVANIPVDLMEKDRAGGTGMMPSGDWLTFIPAKGSPHSDSERRYFEHPSVEMLRAAGKDLLALADTIDGVLSPPSNLVSEESDADCTHCQDNAEKVESVLAQKNGSGL